MENGRADKNLCGTKRKMNAKKVIAVMLSVVLLLGCLPATALAAGEDILVIDGVSTSEVQGSTSFNQMFGPFGISSYYSGSFTVGETQLSAQFPGGGQAIMSFDTNSLITPSYQRGFDASTYTDGVYNLALSDISLDAHKTQAWYAEMLDPEKSYYGFLAVKDSAYSAFILEAAPYSGENHPPVLKSGVAATAEEVIYAGGTYTLDLTSIFEDQDPGAALSYKVSVDGADAAAADASYSYTPDSAGTHVLVFVANDGTVDSTDTYTVTLTLDANHRPVRKEGVDAETEATTTAGTTYTLDLNGIFEDPDAEDTLAYKVSIDGSDVTAADASYSYTPDSPGTHVLAFTANDGKADSTDTYTVTLRVSAAGSDTVPAIEGGVYQIENAEHLAWFRDLVNGTLTDGTQQNAGANAVLKNDIDLSAVCSEAAGSWTPIGTYYPTSSQIAYTGNFDGHGFKLTHLYIDATARYGGLFGYNAGTIRNLTIENGTLQTSQRYFGAIAGYNAGRINNCLNKANVTSSDTRAAGLVGEMGDGGVIASCANTGDVSTTSTSSASYLAGIVAEMDSATVKNCYNTGDITSCRSYLGGIVAQIANKSFPEIINCYNAGNVASSSESPTALGGLISRAANSSTWAETTIENNYYLSTGLININLPALANGPETLSTQCREVNSETEMQALASALGGAYQADGAPALNGGYPVLSWQITGALFAGVSAAPALTQDLSGEPVTYAVGEAAAPLSVSATSPDGGTLSYQWYKSATTPNAGAPIDGATNASYTPTTTAAERVYYYVTVTNQSGANDPKSIISGSVMVTVGDPSQSGIPSMADGVYRIENANQFAWFRDLVNGTGMSADPGANAILMDDIDLSDVCGETAGPQGTRLSWAPIGSRDAPYTGDFNGNGKKLTNLYIHNPMNTYQALFGQNDGTIRNLTIESGSVQSAYARIATLAAISTGNIYNCLNKASVTIDNNDAGGLVYKAEGGVIANSANMGDVTCIRSNIGQSVNLGGIAGNCDGATIINCYNTGDIDAGEHIRAAGIAAVLSSNSVVKNCYNTGAITGMNELGGISALVNNSRVWNGLLLDNNYCLQGACEFLFDTDFEAAEAQGAFATQTELQNMAAILGSAYQADTDPAVNGGYPILGWQASGAQAATVSLRPVIEADLSTTTTYYQKNATTTQALSVTAATPASGALSYQWYASTAAGNQGFSPIEGATGSSYVPPVSEAGAAWYYVAITNTEDGKEPATVKSLTAPVTVTEALTVKFDGQEMTGDRLRNIAEDVFSGGLTAARNVKKFEIISGTLTKDDYSYLIGTLVNSNTNTGVSVLIGEAPEVDASEAFSDGINNQRNSKLFRMEIPGVQKISSLGLTGEEADADRLPTLYAPGVTEIKSSSNTGAFYQTNVATLYLPNLQKIGDYAFRRLSGLKNLVLPGDMPAVGGSDAFLFGETAAI